MINHYEPPELKTACHFKSMALHFSQPTEMDVTDNVFLVTAGYGRNTFATTCTEDILYKEESTCIKILSLILSVSWNFINLLYK